MLKWQVGIQGQVSHHDIGGAEDSVYDSLTNRIWCRCIGSVVGIGPKS